jgi:hypothetical protein
MLRVRVGGAINPVPACRQTVSLGFWEAFQPQRVIVPVPIGVGLPRGSASQSFYLSESGGLSELFVNRFGQTIQFGAIRSSIRSPPMTITCEGRGHRTKGVDTAGLEPATFTG